jgi:hypothetical protein
MSDEVKFDLCVQGSSPQGEGLGMRANGIALS